MLFLCTGNSCRSQMAEGWARSLHPERIEPFSAGTIKHGLNLHAVHVMGERGIDISRHYSKTLEDLGPIEFDLVVTVCGNAHESCPVFPGNARVVHHGFDDPPKMAESAKSPEEALDHYRRVRDEIGEFVWTMTELLT
ncbi:MAG: arsenate reductase ArsC [Phycisphaerales bacterium]|nr:arsenate reductase ArsC [Phycisphaerales bacterium]